jgi:hypothetical protein
VSAQFDTPLKELVDEFGPDWVRWLAPALNLPATVRAAPFRAELSTVQLLADRVFRLNPANLGLLHLEPQANWDGDLLQRLHEYNVLLHRHADHVHTVLLLLRREANRPVYDGELTRFLADGTESNWFRYHVVRVWELRADDLLTGDVGLLPLALLTDDAEPRLGQVVDRVAARLDADRVREATRRRIMTCGWILSGLRYNADRLQQAFERVHGMHESSTYQLVLREGQVGSKQEALLDVLRARFGTVSPELEQRIANTTDLPTLTRWIRAAATVATPDDLPL